MGPGNEQDERPDAHHERKPEELPAEERDASEHDRPVMEELGRGEAATDEHSG